MRRAAPALAILAAAAALRLLDLDLKPFHHDEGVNGHFLLQLYRDGSYNYDPANYHGPTLVMLAWLSTHALGLTDFALRLVPAAFGVATVALALGLGGRLGAAGALTAGVLIAVSPGAVYHSRYFIHEMLFVFLSLALVVLALRYRDSPRVLLAAACGAVVALLYATKETALITLPVLALAAVGAHLYVRLRGPAPGTALLPTVRRPLVAVAAAAAAFAAVGAVIFSVFFTDTDGIAGAVEALAIWADTGTSADGRPLSSYVQWLGAGDPALLGVGLAGCAAVLAWRPRRFEVFCALWALGMLAAYSLIPYKNPWLGLNVLIPLALAAGCGLEAVGRRGPRARFVATAAVAVVVALSALQAVVLNFDRYDDEDAAYTFAHTQRDTLALVRSIDRLSVAEGTRRLTPISVASQDYWPLPWYLRDYRAVLYGAVFTGDSSQTLVIASEEEMEDSPEGLGPDWGRAGTFTLRPGVELTLFAPADLLRLVAARR